MGWDEKPPSETELKPVDKPTKEAKGWDKTAPSKEEIEKSKIPEPPSWVHGLLAQAPITPEQAQAMPWYKQLAYPIPGRTPETTSVGDEITGSDLAVLGGLKGAKGAYDAYRAAEAAKNVGQVASAWQAVAPAASTAGLVSGAPQATSVLVGAPTASQATAAAAEGGSAIARKLLGSAGSSAIGGAALNASDKVLGGAITRKLEKLGHLLHH